MRSIKIQINDYDPINKFNLLFNILINKFFFLYLNLLWALKKYQNLPRNLGIMRKSKH